MPSKIFYSSLHYPCRSENLNLQARTLGGLQKIRTFVPVIYLT
jgi:hypothetical protein